MNTNKKAIRALVWSAIDRTCQQIIQLSVGILLARLLAPTDFGLMGIIMLFAGISYCLIEGGLGQALAREQHEAHRYYSSVWYFQMALATGLYLLFFLAAPHIADFFQQPALTKIIRVLFLALFFNAAYLIQHTHLGILLNYRMIAYCNVTATLISGIAGVTMAWLHCGVWALVTQQVSYHFVRLCVFCFYTHWLPSGKFSTDFFKKHGRFSVNLLATGLLNASFSNLYATFIGKLYPIAQTGYYTQAQKQNDTIQFMFLSIFNNVSYNLFAQTQKSTEELKTLFVNLQQKANLLTIPLFVLLAALSPTIFTLLLGEKWLMAVPYFQLLCVAQVCSANDLLCYNLLNARGHTQLTFRIEGTKKIGMLLSLSLLPMGIQYTLATYAVLCWIFTFIWMYQVNQELALGLKTWWKNIVPALGIGCIAGCLVWNINLLIPSMSYFWMGIEVIMGLLLYLALVARTYPQFFQEAKEMLFILREKED